MKLKHFSIRDLLWLTALCAVLVAWWIDHERLSSRSQCLPGLRNLPQAVQLIQRAGNKMP